MSESSNQEQSNNQHKMAQPSSDICDTTLHNPPVREQHNGIHGSNPLFMSSHTVSHDYDENYRMQKEMIEKRDNSKTTLQLGDDQDIKQHGVPAYYTESWKNPGWFTVLGTFLLNIYIWGVVSGWGVFQVL
ncbi:hypothetical protein K492DRAFT_192997 [Lichtheimia hyalospora FSU 10163]|nr:hypothetical protein K492DRAFT_192997 [Lichtheimia hyalospora FSU 10163]